MEVLEDRRPLAGGGCVVTIGAFDGVHLGHQHVIGEVRALAAAQGAASAVVTFDRHPASIVRPASAPKVLTDLSQKLELLAAAGVDYTLVVHFDETRSRESAEDFVTEVLVGRLRTTTVVVGQDFHFGHRRRGNVELLSSMGAQIGFEVRGLPLVGNGAPISSTRIRQLLAGGDVQAAAGMLGRNHEVRGQIFRGDGRGRELGFPTANLDVPPDVCLPVDGIYAGWYQRPDGEVHAAALSLGRRPTFYEGPGSSLLEAHLLDFDGDLYGETAAVRFLTRLRPEERFESIEDLVAQIGRDVIATRQVLADGAPAAERAAAERAAAESGYSSSVRRSCSRRRLRWPW